MHPQNPKARTQKMAIQFPVRGLVKGQSMAVQPELTSQEMQNVMAFAALDDRSRGGQRGGFSRAASPGTTTTNGLWTAPYVNGTAVAYKSVGFNNSGAIMVGATPANFGAPAAFASFASSAGPVVATDIYGIIYAARGGGANIGTYNLATSTAGTLSASGRPTSIGIVVNWRSRLCCAGDNANPQNVYLARAGTPTDFDYSQTDDLAAVALNAATQAGRVGQPVTALCPLYDDNMVIGCTHSILMLEGDPAQGGSLTVISANVGMISQQLWTVNTQGDLYFWGTRGFYRIKRGTKVVEKISLNRVDSFFNQLAPTLAVSFPSMIYDPAKRGVWISGGVSLPNASTMMFYDEQNDAFFPQTLPSTLVHTGACIGSDGVVYTGGSGGQIWKYDETALTDDGTAIGGYAEIGPFMPAGMGTATLMDLEFYTGDINSLSFGLTYTVSATKGAYESIFNVGNKSYSFTFTTNGRQKHMRQRLTGRSFLVRVGASASGKFFDIDQIVATFMKAADIVR